MEQWMNIAMYAIIMFTIAISTILILKKLDTKHSGRWHQFVIAQDKDGKLTVYLDGESCV